ASVISKLKLNSTPIAFLKSGSIGDFLGVDIGQDKIKILKIDTSVTPYAVKTFAMADVPANAFVKDEIKDPAAIGIILRGMLRDNGISDKNVALASPRSLAIIKTIAVDKRLKDK